MADSLPTDGARAIDDASPADRDAKIEQLLVAGLDHYFAERYEQAIAVWTRTLFFDRSHPRARAYIDRARSALAERQRQSEELLQSVGAALEQGQTEDARRLLQGAVDRGASADDVRPLLERLSLQSVPVDVSVDPARPPVSRQPARSPVVGAAADRRDSASGPRSRGGWQLAVVLAVVAGTAVVAIRSGLDVRAWWTEPEPPSGSGTPPSPAQRALVAPRRGEIALGRARALVAAGQLHEALAALEVIRATDPEKAEADRVRADIQRQLLRAAGRQP